MILDQLFLFYLEDIEITHQATTIDSIKYRYRSNIAPYFGKTELEQINTELIKKYQKDLLNGKIRKNEKETFSISYVNILVNLLKRLMKYAYIMEYVDYEQKNFQSLNSISDAVDKNAYVDTQIIWNIQEFERFSQFVSDEQYRVLFHVLYFCGLRKGEALSLKWKNVDLINASLTIVSTASKVKGKGQIIKSPKSRTSYRTIYLNESMKELLLKYYLNKRRKFNDIKNLFVFGDTKMISFSSLDRKFDHYKKISGVSNMNLHGFRHSHATLLLQLTNDVHTVSKRLGHRSIEITETYLHSADSAQKKLMETLEQEIKNARKISSFNDFIGLLERRILTELDNSIYSKNETDKFIKLFEFAKKLKNE
ncbi:site-specific integrase [[Clostridium] spiroforme]|nr:site-specific integrase [Thomasclavelia spiroformis]